MADKSNKKTAHPLTGRPKSEEHKKKIGDANRGKPKSEAHKQALRLNHRGTTGIRRSEEEKAKIGYKRFRLGKTHTEEAKRKMSEVRKGRFAGANHPNWKGGITSERQQMRGSAEYAAWRAAVFQRDGYECVQCHAKNAKGRGRTLVLNADHIRPISLYPEEALLLENGRTLCFQCHKKETAKLFYKK